MNSGRKDFYCTIYHSHEEESWQELVQKLKQYI